VDFSLLVSPAHTLTGDVLAREGCNKLWQVPLQNCQVAPGKAQKHPHFNIKILKLRSAGDRSVLVFPLVLEEILLGECALVGSRCCTAYVRFGGAGVWAMSCCNGRAHMHRGRHGSLHCKRK
jgi:hypothetical protein